MSVLTENSIEEFAIEQLIALGYEYHQGKNIAPDGIFPMRKGFDDVLLEGELRAALQRLNPDLAPAAQDDVIREVRRVSTPQQLMESNQAFHKMLTDGVRVTIRKKGEARGQIAKLIDFDTIENNRFHVINQFTVIENHREHRPDVVLFVNGLPLVVMELKNPANQNATELSAFNQLQTYKQNIASLFTYNGFLVISDGIEARAGSTSASFEYFKIWKDPNNTNRVTLQMETLINKMLAPETLLDIIRHFITFEKVSIEDPKTKIMRITVAKKLAAYHQYYAVNKIVVSVKRAHMPDSDHKGGVVWHTQGSGKSLSMVFTAGKIIHELNNPTIVVITDRNELDDQLFTTFAESKAILRQPPKQADTRDDLKKLLKVASGGVVFTTIQKFRPEDGNVYETLSERNDIIVIADEAHRTQYGFAADEKENKVAKTISTKYGFAKYMRDALPNATYLGFTGTPIETNDKNTRGVFGGYVDIYDIAQALKDNVTLPIYYEPRLAHINISDEGQKLIQKLSEELEAENLSETQESSAKYAQREALIGSKDRLRKVAQDMIAHFEEQQDVFKGKAMIVATSRQIAAQLYKDIVALRPDWDSDKLDEGKIKVIMTHVPASDGPELSRHHTTKDQRRHLATRFKNPSDPFQIAIVIDMWLTGFDAPCLNTIYIDKFMSGHNLMQAIARVNRIYNDKPGGKVVDYIGIAAKLDEARAFYAKGGGGGNIAEEQVKAVRIMEEKREVVAQIYHGFDYKQYFNADTKQKLEIILNAQDCILALGEDEQKRYADEVIKLSQAFAIALPHRDAMKIKEEVSFFQTVKARLVKLDGGTSTKTNVEIEMTIRQTIDNALVTSEVIDIYDAAGINQPNISILSDEFLNDLKNMKHKNIAIELLRRILNDEVKTRAKKNIVQSRNLAEQLDDAIKKYRNKMLTASEVTLVLIEVAKHARNQDDNAQKLKMSPEEYAFYTAVADNESAREILKDKKLQSIALELTRSIRNSASIDWSVKENARAKIRRDVRRILKKYGYPPDAEIMAINLILEQAEISVQGELNAQQSAQKQYQHTR